MSTLEAAAPAGAAERTPAGADGTPAVEARGVEFSYGERQALRGLDFRVLPGEIFGFLGPNGAGKTTTMRILVGLVTPTTGTATFGDLAYADLPHPQQTVGCVLDARFHPGRSGRNHLRVLAPTAGASDRRVDELLGEVGLGEVARQPVGEYSMGMQQRLALAAAMLGDPDYLILDEPANGLDPRLRPGMSASAQIVVERQPGVFLIPTKASFLLNGKPAVYIQKGQNFVTRNIEVGRRNDDDIVVTGGLKEGELVTLESPADAAKRARKKL